MLKAMRVVYTFQPARSSEMAPSSWSSSPGMAARGDKWVGVGCGEGECRKLRNVADSSTGNVGRAGWGEG
jgi:hypothetical protein